MKVRGKQAKDKMAANAKLSRRSITMVSYHSV